MLAIQRIFLALLLTLLTTATVCAQGGIQWLTDPAQAYGIAQREQRLVLLHFYSDSCPPCRMLEQQVFPDPQVAGAVARDYVPVKINTTQARDLVEYYRVRQVPTDVVLDTQGRVLVQTSSPRDAAGYVRMLTELAAARRMPEHPMMGGATPAPAGYPAGPQSSPYEATPPADRAALSEQPGAAIRPEAAGTTAGSFYDLKMPQAANAEPPTNPSQERDERSSRYSMPQSLAVGPRYAEQYRPDEMPTERVLPPQPLGGTPVPRGGSLAASPSPAPPAPDRTVSPPQPTGSVAFRDPLVAEAQPAPASRWDGRASTSTNSNFASYASQNPDPASSPANPSPVAPSPGPAVAPAAIAMEGFCPVTLKEQEQWREGDRRFGAMHRGRTYLFVSAKHQERFLADPDRYSPVLSGYDPVAFIDRGELVDGCRQHGVWYQGNTYLFADEASLQRFETAADYYAQKSQSVMRGGGRR
jgi:YHS domain-containing protein/thioredoxin-like negative regulator of GroEL